MRTKTKCYILALRIALWYSLVRAYRKKTDNYFKKGGTFPSEKSVKMYSRLTRLCNRVMLLCCKYKKLTSAGALPTEVILRETVTK